MLLKNRILYEDNHLIIINKLSGEIVQGDKTGDVPLIESVKSYLKEEYQKPCNVFCGLVHRIDRPVSGAVIFAKTSKALTRMNEMIKNRQLEKKYWALTEGIVEKDEADLVHYLKKNEKLNKSFASTEFKSGWQKAELHFKILKRFYRYTLLEINLKTGRHHQIRVQLSSEGYPICGDLKYGAKRSNESGAILLHARYLKFIHPISQELISIEADILNKSGWKILDSSPIK